MIGIIGYGAMGSALAKGIIKTSSEKVAIFDPNVSKAEENIIVYSNLEDLVQVSDKLIIAVKPNKYKEVLGDVSKVKKGILIISIAVGYEISRIKDDMGIAEAKVIRTMPNTPAQISEGVIGVCKSYEVDEAEFTYIKELFSKFSKVYEIEEKNMHIFSAISGSMPAFIDIFIEAVADAAVYEGLNRSMAYDIIADAISGSAKLVSFSKEHPAVLKDKVTSPAGTTIEGVYELEKNGYRKALMNAIIKTTEKSKNM